MPEDSVGSLDKSHFRNGDDILFDYGKQSNTSTSAPAQNLSNDNIAKKKKKKKSKSKDSDHKLAIRATLNNPEDDYPTSRVIKQAPNGDVIVESLEEETENQKNDCHGQKGIANIWDNATLEEQENLKKFWESLNETEKMKLVKIDKKSIMELFRDEIKAASLSHHSNFAQSSSRSSGCSCSYCGRKNSVIEDELENIYDTHFDDIIDFIHEVRDINDLNALPGLLFGGFHMLEQEHKLQKRQAKHRHSHDGENCNHNHGAVKAARKNSDSSRPRDSCSPEVSHDSMISNRNMLEAINDNQTGMDEQEAFNQLLDPKLFEALEGLDLDRIRQVSTKQSQTKIAEKANSLREIIRDFQRADKSQLEKGMAFLQGMGKVFKEEARENSGESFNEEISKGLSKFAEDLLKNDGNTFIDMLESLSESKSEREDLLKNDSDGDQAFSKKIDISDIIKDVENSASEPFRDLKRLNELMNDHELSLKHDHGPELQKIDNMNHYDIEDEEVNGIGRNEDMEEYDYADEDDVDVDEDDDDEDVGEDGVEDYEDEDEEIDISDTESEISEEEKMQEIRRLFLIQVIKLFQERLNNAYKEKLSQDRTKMLIAELEAEENAKKEKELKKLKQKEKAKEKKRMQQLAKEEERRKKEEAQRLKEEELREKQEAIRAEQKRKKDEAKQKRDELKRKKLEELQRKEEEQKKRLEAQRKKEEAKRLKEDLRIKEEAQRKAEEQKRKELELLERKQQEKLERSRIINEKESVKPSLSDDSQKAQLWTASEGSGWVSAAAPEEANYIAPKRTINDEIVPSSNNLLNQLTSPVLVPLLTTPTPVTVSNTYLDSNAATSSLAIFPGSNILKNLLLSHANTSGSPNIQLGIMNSPWSGHNKMAPQSSYQAPMNTNSFSPFNRSRPADVAPMVAPSNLNSSVWNSNTSRNGSIWNNNSTSNPLWGESAAGPPANSLLPNNDLLQLTIFDAFQLLSNTNQLEFGLAPCLKLFQQTKALLGNENLNLTSFLNACRTSPRYNFDFVYDEFGTVTYIKINLVHHTPAILSATSLPQDGSSLTSNFAQGTDTSSILNKGPISNQINGTRNLWY
ncbi:uncharacterized protein PRCAT00004403001 [Priceomyces carsonii]|uniref:uncharacterized protein n=1 Tax=Priceomyces carsonii TaxID=28549 RepID=UPI002EDB07EE|nr:unnamed protein product [Priceomyces carsonii]